MEIDACLIIQYQINTDAKIDESLATGHAVAPDDTVGNLVLLNIQGDAEFTVGGGDDGGVLCYVHVLCSHRIFAFDIEDLNNGSAMGNVVSQHDFLVLGLLRKDYSDGTKTF